MVRVVSITSVVVNFTACTLNLWLLRSHRQVSIAAEKDVAGAIVVNNLLINAVSLLTTCVAMHAISSYRGVHWLHINRIKGRTHLI